MAFALALARSGSLLFLNFSSMCDLGLVAIGAMGAEESLEGFIFLLNGTLRELVSSWSADLGAVPCCCWRTESVLDGCFFLNLGFLRLLLLSELTVVDVVLS